jgi:hypothetical protein
MDDKCIDIDSSFEQIKLECGFLSRYSNEIRYPFRIQVYEEDIIYVMNSVEKIKNMNALKKIREEILQISKS